MTKPARARACMCERPGPDMEKPGLSTEVQRRPPLGPLVCSSAPLGPLGGSFGFLWGPIRAQEGFWGQVGMVGL